MDVSARELVDARVRLDIGRDRDRGVVHETLPDTGKRRADLDPQVLQMPGRPDARAQQMGRGVDGATGQDHLASAELDARRLDMRDHADAPLVFEQQLAHLRVSQDREIAALAGGRIKVADGCRNAPLIGIGDRDGVVAVLPFPVLVGQIVETRGLERLGCRLGVLIP